MPGGLLHMHGMLTLSGTVGGGICANHSNFPSRKGLGKQFKVSIFYLCLNLRQSQEQCPFSLGFLPTFKALRNKVVQTL